MSRQLEPFTEQKADRGWKYGMQNADDIQKLRQQRIDELERKLMDMAPTDE